jgi:DnaK suppressor protein
MSQMTKAKASKDSARVSAYEAAPSVAKPVKSTKSATAVATPAPIRITEELIKECKGKLLQSKADLLNRVKEARHDLNNDDKGGDEADQTVRVLAEAEFLNTHERMRVQLMEIESALGRIENGTFGICEETEEMIEPERLRAIPWTRLSIEGAEIRESMNKRFARG